MAAVSRTHASLRIFGDDLDPDEITRLLGGEPTSVARRGEASRTQSGRSVVARSGSWLLQAEEAAPGDLNGQITAILAKLTSDLSVWENLTKRFKCDVFCGLFMDGDNEGAELEPSTLTMLGLRGLSIGLDIYCLADCDPR